MRIGSGGLLTGSGSVTGNVLVDGGNLAPASNPASLAISGSLTFASNGSLASGGLSAGSEYIGSGGSASFTQTGGTHSVLGNLVLGPDAASAGAYNLNGGLLVLSSSGISQGAAPRLSISAAAPGAQPHGLPRQMNLTGSGGAATVDTTGGNIGLSGVLTGPGGLTKIGQGSLTLAGMNSYAGPTQVTGGTLRIGPSGSIAAASAITVSNSSTLAVTASTNLPRQRDHRQPGQHLRHHRGEQLLAGGRQPVDDRPPQRPGHAISTATSRSAAAR